MLEFDCTGKVNVRIGLYSGIVNVRI